MQGFIGESNYFPLSKLWKNSLLSTVNLKINSSSSVALWVVEYLYILVSYTGWIVGRWLEYLWYFSLEAYLLSNCFTFEWSSAGILVVMAAMFDLVRTLVVGGYSLLLSEVDSLRLLCCWLLLITGTVTAAGWAGLGGVGKVRAGNNGGLGIIGRNNGLLDAFLVYPGGTHGKIQAPGNELIAGKEAICFLAVVFSCKLVFSHQSSFTGPIQ